MIIDVLGPTSFHLDALQQCGVSKIAFVVWCRHLKSRVNVFCVTHHCSDLHGNLCAPMSHPTIVTFAKPHHSSTLYSSITNMFGFACQPVHAMSPPTIVNVPHVTCHMCSSFTCHMCVCDQSDMCMVCLCVWCVCVCVCVDEGGVVGWVLTCMAKDATVSPTNHCPIALLPYLDVPHNLHV